MRKWFLLCMLFVVLPGLAGAQTLEVTNPDSSSVWKHGESPTITWTKTGTQHARVKIQLYNGAGTNLIRNIKNDTENDGAFKVKIPTTINPGFYRIRIVTLDNAISDMSDKFKVEAKLLAIRPMMKTPTLAAAVSAKDLRAMIPVTGPAAGQKFKRGDKMDIFWDKNVIAAYGKVHIFLYSSDGKKNIYTIGSTPPANAGQYSWTISHVVPLQEYIVRVTTPDEKYSGNSGIFLIWAAGDKTPIKRTFNPNLANKWGYRYTDNGHNDCLMASHPAPGRAAGPGEIKIGRFSQNREYKECSFMEDYNFYGRLFFDVSSLKNLGTVKSARLVINCVEKYQIYQQAGSLASNEACVSQADIYLLASAWPENLPLRNFYPGAKIYELICLEGQNKSIDLTHYVNQWVRGEIPNHGLMVRDPVDNYANTNTACLKYYGSITLEVEYIPYF